MSPQSHAQLMLVSLYRKVLRAGMRRRLRPRMEPLPPRLLLSFTASGGEIAINTITTGNQNAPAVAISSGGQIAYQYATPGGMTDPAVAIRDDGEYIVAWTSNTDIHAQLFNSDGTTLGSEFVADDIAAGAQSTPAVAMNASGDFVIAWQGQGPGDTDGIFARRFAPDGTALGGQFRVNASTTNAQVKPAVGIAGDGSFLIAFRDTNSGGSLDGQFFNASGVGQGQFTVTNSGDPDFPAVAANASGSFVVAFAEHVSGDMTAMYRRYNSTGGSINSSEVQVDSGQVGDQQDESVGIDGSGNFIVAWDESGRDGGGYGVFARRVLNTGSFDGSTIRVNTTTAGDQLDPAVATNAFGSTVIAWTGAGTPDNQGIYAQLYGSANQPPVNAVPAAQTTAEDTPLTLSSANGNAISMSDADAGSNAVQMTLSLTSGTMTLATLNGLTFSTGDGIADGTMTFIGTIASINAAMNGMTFTPATDANGSVTLTVTSNDRGFTGAGGAQSDTDTVAINVTAVNDAPVNHLPPPQTVSGGGLLNLGASYGAPLSISDVDAGSSPVQVTLTASVGTISLATTTGLTFTTGTGSGDATMTFRGTVAAINNALDGMSYSPPFLLLSNPTIDITTNDLGNTGAGGAKSDTDTLSLNTTPANQPPVNTVPGAQAINEDDPLVFASTNGNAITVADPDAGANPVKVTLTANNGKITLNGTSGLTFLTGDGSADGTMTFTGTLADVNNALSGLVFNPPVNLNGLASLQIVTDDQGNSGAGGAQTDTSAVTINIAAVNDAPVNTVPGDQTLLEDTPLTFSTANGNLISIADVDAGSGPMSVTLTASVGTISLATTTGLTFSTGDGTADAMMTFTGTLASINAALDGLIYAPPLNYNGGAALQISTDDQGNSGAGGSLNATSTILMSITAVNDAPVNTVPSGATVAEDNTISFTGGTLAISDVDAGQNAMRVTLAGTNGVMTLSQTTGLTFITGDGTSDANLDFTGAQADINAALDGLTFTPDANFNGAAGIGMATSDQGASGAGGELVTTTNFNITVTAVNDAPVLSTPGNQATGYQTDLVFNSTFNNLISVSDVDAASGQLQVTLSTSNGTLTLAALTGLTFSLGDGAADAAMTFTGTLPQINDALSGLTFSPAAGYMGTTQLNVAVDDQGNTGAGGNQTASASINILVANDAAPVLSATPSSLTYVENAGSVAVDPAISLSDADSASMQGATVRIVNDIASEDSLQFADQNGISGSFNATTGVLTLTGTASLANYQAALRSVGYQNSSDNPTASPRTIRFVVNDGTLNSAPVDRTVTITPVNDAPTSTGIGDVNVHEDAPPTTLNIAATVSDADDPTTSLSFAIVSNSNAALFKSVQLDAATGMLKLAYQRNANGDAALVIRVTDPHGASVDMPFAVHVSPVNDAPVLAINAGLHADLGAAATIGDRALLVQDVDNTAAELTATLTAAPAHGTLELNGVALTVGGTFTQQDVNDGKLRFQANPGVDAVTDAITFNVSDGAGGTLGSVTFAIDIAPAATGPVVPPPPPPPPTGSPVAPPVGATSPVLDGTGDAPPAAGDVTTATTTNIGQSADASSTITPVPQPPPAPPARTPTGGGGNETVAAPADVAPAPVAAAPVPVPAPAAAKPEVAKVEPPRAERPAVPIAPAHQGAVAAVPAQAPFSLQSKAAAQQVAFVISPGAALSKDLNTLRQSLDAPMKNVRIVAGSAGVLSVGVSMIYLLWTIRGGYLLASLLSSMPAWRLIDPLPILDHFDDDQEQKKRRDDDSDDESLESLAEGKRATGITPRSMP